MGREGVLTMCGRFTQNYSWADVNEFLSLFGPPLNTRYIHKNLDPFRPARILMVTNAPITFNLYHNDILDEGEAPGDPLARHRAEEGGCLSG